MRRFWGAGVADEGVAGSVGQVPTEAVVVAPCGGANPKDGFGAGRIVPEGASEEW